MKGFEWMNIYEKLLEKIKSILSLYLRDLSNIDRRKTSLNIYSDHDNILEKELFKKGFRTPYEINQFSSSQQFQILLGLNTGVDISKYANPEVDSEQMNKIWATLLTEKVNNDLVLKRKLEVKIIDRGYNGPYDLSEFDNYQLRQILNGLEIGVNVNEYANPEVSSTFMKDRWKTLSLDLDDEKCSNADKNLTHSLEDDEEELEL